MMATAGWSMGVREGMNGPVGRGDLDVLESMMVEVRPQLAVDVVRILFRNETDDPS